MSVFSKITNWLLWSPPKRVPSEYILEFQYLGGDLWVEEMRAFDYEVVWKEMRDYDANPEFDYLRWRIRDRTNSCIEITPWPCRRAERRSS